MLALLALAARADATPAADPFALAIQYANALTGEDADDDDDGPADRSAARPGDADDGIDSDDRDDAVDAAGTDGETSEHAGELGLDDDLGGTTVLTSDELGYASSPAGAAESYEARLRRRRTSWFGRIDLALSWRRHASEPRHSPAHQDDELWLLATWRR